MTLTLPAEVPMSQQPRTKRPISVNRGQAQVRRLTALRTEHREARLYAQQWYAALRVWAVHYPTVLPKISYAAFREQGHFDALTMGDGGPPQKTFLRTPAGEISEVEIGQVITDMTLSAVPETVQLGRMLDRLRRHDNSCMESLLRGTSWSQNRESAVRYAIAVLTLAVRLGDVHAERPLRIVQAELFG
ncbi:hypothetical protein K7W42_18025 [Deinococcus sp. HMF7604]|uniref:hypothetical protein n=1 Tax=Deinococcus betulae TaxID=2873312 RepID=UPI001CCED274|nr:hypothetical protein [Deinococcus betulae]MBZ9752742.1 hypothetical protein [Deinococcus betulae]